MKDEEARRKAESMQHDPRGRRLLVLDWMPQLRNSCYIFSEANDALFEKPPEGAAKIEP